MRINRPNRRKAPTLLGAAAGAYLIPGTMTYANALVIDNAQLATAAWTTIAGPSAVAAVGATILARRSASKSLRHTVMKAALTWTATGAAVTGWMVGNDWLDPIAFTQIPVSAGIGAAIATRKTRRAVDDSHMGSESATSTPPEPSTFIDPLDMRQAVSQ